MLTNEQLLKFKKLFDSKLKAPLIENKEKLSEVAKEAREFIKTKS